MTAPTLLIGLGGAGSKIVRRVANMVTPQQRKRLSFVVLDTDINELRQIEEANPFIHCIQTSDPMTVGEYLTKDIHARDTWFPVNPILNDKALTEGAGQVRAVSRLAFDTAVRSGKLEKLHRAIQELYKLEPDVPEQALRITIVGSLAGGTGSGLILPVAMYIKNYLKNHYRNGSSIVRGFFLLPEVFYSVILSEVERNNLKANAYAALREIDAFLMKGDSTLDKEYKDSVKIEFPKVANEGSEEYNVRPYDFCFLFDGQNSNGNTLNSHSEYLDHAAYCIYQQSAGPINKRVNSSEDNTVRSLCAENGRNRYAGVGCSTMLYPVEDVTRYISLNWANECLSNRWLQYDNDFAAKIKKDSEERDKGMSVPDTRLCEFYTETINKNAEKNDGFAKAIQSACGYDGTDRNAWSNYVYALKEAVTRDIYATHPDYEQSFADIKGGIDSLTGGANSNAPYVDVFDNLEYLRFEIDESREKTGRNIAYTMFSASFDYNPNDKQAHRLETYMHDDKGDFIHPNAIRYFLYNVQRLLENQKAEVSRDVNDARRNFNRFADDFFDDETTEVHENSANFKNRKIRLINLLTKNPDEMQEKVQSRLSDYCDDLKKYCTNVTLEYVLDAGLDYVRELCRAFEKFFMSFKGKVAALPESASRLAHKYDRITGTTTRYVCATSTCMKALSDEVIYTGGTLTIDSQLARDIFERVKKFAVDGKRIADEEEEAKYFDDIYENGIMRYFDRSVIENYGRQIDVDIITALEKEIKIKRPSATDAEVEAYIKKEIENTRALAAPFIEKPIGEIRQEVSTCTYGKELISDKDSRRAKFIVSILGKLDDDEKTSDNPTPKNTIIFYKAMYGLRANGLSKFAPPSKSRTLNRAAGEYYKAYFDLIENIYPVTDKSKFITPHIDRWWHIVTKFPDLDEDNQIMQEKRINAAFFWGILCGFVSLTNVFVSSPMYCLNTDELRMTDASEKLVVTNGTECDRFYEVIDAFSAYPKLVTKVLERIDHMTSYDVDKAIPLEEGVLMSNLATFRVQEFKLGEDNRVRSIFDIPVLMKKSVKADIYDENSVSAIINAETEEIKKYLTRMCDAKELPDIMGSILHQQFELFIEDMASETIRNKSFFHDSLFTKICTKIALAFEDIGLERDARAIIAKQKELSR